MTRATSGFGWATIVRLGLVQASIGAVVVLTTSTLNRVMVVELALPALLPGALVAFYHLVQVMRPRMGHGSDVGGRRTPWIMGGMAVLATGGVLAALAVTLMPTARELAIAVAFVAFALIGLDDMSSTSLVDAVLAVLVLKIVGVLGLAVGGRRTLHLLPTLASGLILVVALRLALDGAPWPVLGGCLLGAGIAHAVDLFVRLRPRP